MSDLDTRTSKETLDMWLDRATAEQLRVFIREYRAAGAALEPPAGDAEVERCLYVASLKQDDASHAAHVGHEIEDGLEEDFEPYEVTCARCGKVLPCTEAIVEEGDEWECPPCWERCEAKERAAVSE